MPQRRSQNLPLDDPLTPSRASGRRRKPTTRAEQPKTTDRAGPPDRAAPSGRAAPPGRRRRRALIPPDVDDPRLPSTPELPSTSRQSSPPEPQLPSLPRRPEPPSLRRSRPDSPSPLSRPRYWGDEPGIPKDRAGRPIAFSAAGIAARAKHQKEQQDWADAARRLRDNKAREEALWQAEIDEHGEQEAIRRRRLDRQTRKEADELPTLSLKLWTLKIGLVILCCLYQPVFV